MITSKEYQSIERFNIKKFMSKYEYEFNVYSITSYKLFGIITLFKSKKLIQSGRDSKYRKPKKRERY